MMFLDQFFIWKSLKFKENPDHVEVPCKHRRGEGGGLEIVGLSYAGRACLRINRYSGHGFPFHRRNDRGPFFPTQIVVGVLHLLGALFLYLTSQAAHFNDFFLWLLLHLHLLHADLGSWVQILSSSLLTVPRIRRKTLPPFVPLGQSAGSPRESWWAEGFSFRKNSCGNFLRSWAGMPLLRVMPSRILAQRRMALHLWRDRLSHTRSLRIFPSPHASPVEGQRRFPSGMSWGSRPSA